MFLKERWRFTQILAVYWFLWGSVAQWLARRTRDPVVAGLIPTTAHDGTALKKQFT